MRATPAPWTAGEAIDGATPIHGALNRWGTIMEVCLMLDTGCLQTNARNLAIVTSAPDMLKAIRDALPWIERTGIADSDPPEYLALKRALDKAERLTGPESA